MPLDTNTHSQQPEQLPANPSLTEPALHFPSLASRFSRPTQQKLLVCCFLKLYTRFPQQCGTILEWKKISMKEWEINGENAGSAMHKLANASERIK